MSRERPLPELRFIINDRTGEKILQQRWAMPYRYVDNYGDEALDYDYEWRNVPLETSPACTVAKHRV